MNFFDLPLGQILHKRARQYKRLEAIVGPRRRLTYEEYDKLSNQVAHYLLSLGIKKGDRVAIIPETNITYPLLLMGTLKIGAVVVTLNWRWTQDLLNDVISDVEPKILFYDESFTDLVYSLQVPEQTRLVQSSHQVDLEPEFAKNLAALPTTYPEADVTSEDLAIIAYTSGTTGKPKGVVLTHANLHASGLNNGLTGCYRFTQRVLIPTMLGHISSISILTFQSMIGFTVIFMPELTPHILLETIEREKINIMFVPPQFLRLILPMIYKSEYVLTSLTEIQTGGSLVPRSLIEDYEQLGFRISIIYGATESAGAGCYWSPVMGMEHANSAGRPYLFDVAIFDRETREMLPAGKIGEIAFKGPMVFKEYWHDPVETKKAKYQEWFLTGDAGYMDKNEYVHIVDRYKDVIFFGGVGAIFPSKVEGVIKQMEEVADAALVGLHHEKWGEIPCAFVVPAPESDLAREKVFAHVYSQLPKHNLVDVIFVDDLPRNALGKVDKPLLKKNHKPDLKNL
ncbi:class I adenylate-forming enzyme family protein [Thermoactinomyces mirandus]|uniref:AMP-binding protein n=1 Tax=Thermoactinomyces mirandus TaxID=2756294 RepID=A0A7W1XQA1_9BACL|nr:AMP-binding protein [Thermoactinomyces mirandus]MBA4601216.1 AMP-binding protein [Thermoactinomyces mirandus]